MKPLVYSVAEVCRLLGVHPTTIHRWCSAETFVPKVRLGASRIGFLAVDVDAWIADRRGKAA